MILIAPIFVSASHGKDLPKIAVWDLTSGDIKAAYAQDLTFILVSEISKVGKYEVYSQENVRTLAGWTEERMKLGCSSTQCLTALGQMDIAKLVSGRVGKIGNRYLVSLSLFDTQNAKAEKAISEVGRSEDELIELVQAAARKLLGIEVPLSKTEEKPPSISPAKAEVPKVLAKTGSGMVPIVNGQVKEIKFFEAPYDILPKEKRVYTKRFSKTQTRFVYFELNLDHPQPAARIDFEVQAIYYRPDGGELGRLAFKTYIVPEWAHSWHANGWGYKEFASNTWQAGRYRVDLFVGGNKIGSDSFEVY